MGHHHFSIIPCKLTRCLAALPCLSPCLPLLQGRVLWQQRGHAVINAGAGSPAASAHHVLLCISGWRLPASPAQAGLATMSPGKKVAWHIAFPKHHSPAHPHKGAAAPGHPTQVLAGTPPPNYPTGPIYWGDKKSNGPQKAINLTAASQRTPPDEEPNRSQQGAEIGCPGETQGLWEPFREHIKVNQPKTLELWTQKSHRGLKPFASTDKVRGSWEAARDAGNRSTERLPSQTCPKHPLQPGMLASCSGHHRL